MGENVSLSRLNSKKTSSMLAQYVRLWSVATALRVITTAAGQVVSNQTQISLYRQSIARCDLCERKKERERERERDFQRRIETHLDDDC